MKITIFLTLTFLLFATVTSKPDLRVIGGQNAAAGQFPFIAAINVQTANSKFFCGGALMRNQWILTSASCVYNATLLTIQLGSLTLTDDDSNRITVATSEYIVHPDFDPETIQNDVALIKLRMSVESTDFLQNISFYLPEIKAPVVVVGWGQTSDYEAGLSEHLQYVSTSPLTNEECKLVYGNQITDEMICVEGNYNEGTCTGDNGGPLLYHTIGKYYVVGVASFISGNGCESTDPSGFTRITPYYYWLHDTMEGKN